MEECIFCKIIKGDLPCYKIYEDDYTLAFLDIADDVVGHTLVIPKKHCHNILDCSEINLNHVMATVQKISKHYVEVLGYDSVNLMNVNELVPHFHIHIFPRKKGDGIDICTHYPKQGSDLKLLSDKMRLK